VKRENFRNTIPFCKHYCSGTQPPSSGPPSSTASPSSPGIWGAAGPQKLGRGDGFPPASFSVEIWGCRETRLETSLKATAGSWLSTLRRELDGRW